MAHDADIRSSRQAYLLALKRERWLVRMLRVGLLLFMVALWQVASSRRWVDPFLVSSPAEVWTTLRGLAAQGNLWIHVETTLLETLVGFVGGTLLGVASAAVLWWSPLVSKVADPYLTVLNALPKIALGPIFLIWLPPYPAIVAMALAISLIVTVMMVWTGFQDLPGDHLRLLRSLNATRWQILTTLVLPGSLPSIMAALKVNAAMSLVGVIVGEFLVSKQGLGYLIIYGGQVFQMNLVMASVVILAVLAAVLYGVVAWCEARFLKWQR